MDVFVVSRSRPEQSDTLRSLGGVARTVTLVVPNLQVRQYRTLAAYHGCKLLGCPYDGIARTREFCGVACQSGRFLMLDDDLRFTCRASPTDWHLRIPEEVGRTVGGMLEAVDNALDHYVHVAVSAREGNNRLPYEGAECSRPLRALAYRKTEFMQLSHGRVKIMEDFDVTMQLLRKGYKNLVIASWAQNQRMTQMTGGCSDYRTHELHEQNVKLFAKLHSPFVRLRKKQNKTGGEFGSRLEATIYWKKAWESSQ